MLTSVIGFPRVGSLRELKFATEKYFRHECTEIELRQVAHKLRRAAWQRQREAGITFIPSGDFSFYDGILDTAFLFDLIPARYRELDLSELDRYFAAAHGYQGEKGDVKALPMKKWFNTNYHYIVPEIEDNAHFHLAGHKILTEFAEAQASGILTKPVICGPFTFLHLARYMGRKGVADYIEEAAQAYAELLQNFAKLGAEWVQFDEPFLVHDLSAADIACFTALYEKILAAKGSVKILLQTYFGDIRDIYPTIMAMPFDGVGLDFVEGKQTAALVEQYGFPADKILFAGVVNGKNIWRNHYAKTLKVLQNLQSHGITTVVSTSCSLLHVPYTLAHEQKLPAEVKKHFAFAYEKLTELRELGDLAENPAGEALARNEEIFDGSRYVPDQAVSERVKQIRDEDFTRQPAFAAREKRQHAEFRLPLFPTTTIGSFPQTQEVKAARKKLRTGQISAAQYETFIRDKIQRCIQFQEELGLDVLVHGEYERNDMVEYFGEHLSGYYFTEKAWVQSYGTRCVKPPIIWGDISRKHPITVAWSAYAQSLTDKPVKGMLTGPVTILNWSFPREDISLEAQTRQLALAIRDEVLDLEANGIRIIQIDEAALREKLPLRQSDWYKEYLDWAIPAFRLVHSGVKPETQIHTHMCYSEFTDIIPAIDAMDADVITFEASRSDLQILDALQANHFRTEVGPGVYDIHSPRVPSVEEITDALQKMVKKVDVRKLWVNPDCGLKTRGETEVEQSLQHLVAAAANMRKKYQNKIDTQGQR
ncbi:MAG: 5-methyltetrahydropteroyltriglutamate--homocysteine S-methyltransferase [Selenomonadaceae bacterium]|nr:5-methyltetrahydropteroyltriglutamate--homocysteine S-methyltransferase [Selenomonadaceae bacterium]